MKKLIIYIFVVIYFVLSLVNINRQRLFVADESAYGDSITAFIHKTVDLNNHPLLAKSIVAAIVIVGQILFAYDFPVFWRLPVIIASLVCLYTLFRICRLRYSRQLSWLAVVLVALDPMYFGYSRTLNLDIFSLMFALLSLYFTLRYFQSNRFSASFWSVVCIGLSLACKLNLLFLAFIQPLLVRRRFILSYFLIAMAFVIGNLLFFIFPHNISFLTYFRYMIFSQLNITLANVAKTQFSSVLSWFAMPQILTMYRTVGLDHKVTALVVFQNPLMFVFNIPVLLISFFLLVKKSVNQDNRYLAVVFIYLTGQLLPLCLNLRPGYYYYMIQLIPLIVILFIELLHRMKINYLLTYMACVITVAVFVLYYPLLVGIPISKKYEAVLFSYSRYRYPPVNTLFCQFCSPR